MLLFDKQEINICNKDRILSFYMSQPKKNKSKIGNMSTVASFGCIGYSKCIK